MPENNLAQSNLYISSLGYSFIDMSIMEDENDRFGKKTFLAAQVGQGDCAIHHQEGGEAEAGGGVSLCQDRDFQTNQIKYIKPNHFKVFANLAAGSDIIAAKM